MSKKMAGVIMAYGIVLAGLSLGIKTVSPELAEIPFLVGLSGGGLCLLWGLAALLGHQRRVGALLTLFAITLVVLSPTLRVWMDSSGTVAARLLLTLMLSLTVVMIMYVMHGERPPEFYQKEPPRQDNTEAKGKNTPAVESRPRR